MSQATETNEVRSPLLARVIGTIAILSFLLFMILWASSWVNSQRTTTDRAHGSIAESSDKYFSLRTLAALKTLEFGIVRASQGDAHATTDADMPDAMRLAAAVPQCAAAWAKRPSWLNRQLASLKGREPAMCSVTNNGGVDTRKYFDECSVGEHIAVSLKLLDENLAQLNGKSNRPFKAPIAFDHAGWLRVVAEQVGKPVRIDGMGEQRIALQCGDISEALALLNHDNGILLEKRVAWRETTPKAVTAMWRPSQLISISTGLLVRRNPWRGLPGCVYLRSAREANTIYYLSDRAISNRAVCENGAVSGSTGNQKYVPLIGEKSRLANLDDPMWKLPPSLSTLIGPLEGLRQPAGELYAKYTENEILPSDDPTAYRYGSNQTTINGIDQPIGFSIQLGTDVRTQAIAQQVAACYTGNQTVCSALKLRRAEDDKRPIGAKLFESAMVRMAAVAIIDVATGQVETLAGDLSPCTRQMYDGPGLDKSCDSRVPGEPRYNADKLLNPAVFHDAMPASTIKPIMAAAFLSSGTYGQVLRKLESNASPQGGHMSKLQDELRTSASKAFLERMFCAEKDYRDCKRPWEIQKSAISMGWDTGCDPESGDCGMQDLLFGRPLSARAEDGQLKPLSLPFMYGRLMTEPKTDNAKHSRLFGFIGEPKSSFEPANVRACSKAQWQLKQCKGAALIDVASEGFGQGHARASAVGVAGLMARLAAAANGMAEVNRPHLVSDIRGVRGPLKSAAERWALNSPVDTGIAPEVARIILGGMTLSHRLGGTADSACHQLFGKNECQKIDWIAGKTGTPSFPLDKSTLEKSIKMCSDMTKKTRPSVCANLRPYKWYAAVFKSDKNGKQWDKAIAVLTERNWETGTEKIHGVGDHGPNPSAEIALQVVSRIRQ